MRTTNRWIAIALCLMVLPARNTWETLTQVAVEGDVLELPCKASLDRTSEISRLNLAHSMFAGASAQTARQKAQQDLVFFDDFEYDVSRSATNAEVAFRAHGWSDVKANNSHFRRGAGYLYTRYDAVRKSRVLVMESLLSQAQTPPGFREPQTDYWVKYGSEDAPLTTIPANVWIQFWTYATPESRFGRRSKTIYPCRGRYPCSRRDGSFGWLFGWGSFGYETVAAPPGGRFLGLTGEHIDYRGCDEYPTNREKLFQNIKRIPLLAGRWYQVKLHIDVSKEQGVYEAWIREDKDASWTKVAEWIGGVTKDFFWPIPAQERVGFRVLAMPTTVNGTEDSTVFIDDFAIAKSEEALPSTKSGIRP